MAQMYVLDANVFVEAARRYYAFDDEAGLIRPVWLMGTWP
jgi:hypothetical protein